MENKSDKKSASLMHQQRYNEEISMEQLAKKALEETIREGGAFAQENQEQFKQ
jgi:hypothetical protein